jgi:hypothetical protein
MILFNEEEKVKNENKIKEIVNFIKNVNLLNILDETDIFNDDKKTNNYFTINSIIDNEIEPLTCYLMVIHYTAESEYFNPYEPTEVRHSLVLETNNPKINKRIQLNDWREAGEYEEVEWNIWDTSEYIQELKEFLSDYIISDEYKKAIKTIWNGISDKVNKLHEDTKIKHMLCNNIIDEYSKI